MRLFMTTLFLSLCALCATAQEKYTDYLQRQKAGKGQVVLHQSARITDLVNGVAASAAQAPASSRQGGSSQAETAQQKPQDVVLSGSAQQGGQRLRANGYRIQVYSGGNSRAAKTEANMMGQRVKSLFLELPVYTHFISPHWICRVGDFRTYEEANEMFQKLKETGRFGEAVIVKSKVNVYVNDPD